MPVTCWANSIGGCSQRQSREHVVSAGFFSSTEIIVSGMPWCEGQTRRIPLATAGSKILCTRHNELLADLDATAKTASETFREVNRLQRFRVDHRIRPTRVARYKIDGSLIERWFLKTAINLAILYGQGLSWGLDGSPIDAPPPEFVSAAFGIGRLRNHMGLSVASAKGSSLYSSETVGFVPVVNSEKVLLACLFEFWGFPFVLSMIDEPLPQKPSFFQNMEDHWRGAETGHHLERLRFEIDGRLSQEIRFVWRS